MVQVIPAVIAKDFTELQEKITKIAPYTSWVQIDVSDGIFTKNVTWDNPDELKNLKSNLSFEMHLMVNDAKKGIEQWIDSGAKRIVVHVSSKDDYQKISSMAEMTKQKNVQFGIALSPEVSVEDVQTLVPLADTVLLLAVAAGFSGQQFQPAILEKIKSLRNLFGDVKIEVDGGINLETAKQCIEAGADILVSASYIFESGNIQESIERLKEIT